MILKMKNLFLGAAAAAVLAAGSPLMAAGPAVLTVSGAVENANRGPSDPDYDKLFAFNDVSFEKAVEFDLEALLALPQVTAKADFPKGGDVHEFSGPTLADVLEAAGGDGGTVTIRAMDGYSVEAPLEEFTGKGAVVALSRDGTPFGIGNFGPTQVVFPRAEREDLAEMPDDWWVWTIYHIVVE